MKKINESMSRIFIKYLIVMLSFGLFMCCGVRLSNDILSRINPYSFKMIILLFPLVIMSLSYITKSLNKSCLQNEKKIHDDTHFDRKYLEEKLKYSAVVFLASIVVFALETYLISIISKARINLELLLILSLLASFTNALIFLVLSKGVEEEKVLSKKRGAVICVLVILLLIGFIIVVPRTISKISTFNMYWEGNHRTPYDLEYDIDDSHKLTIRNQDGTVSKWYYEVLEKIPKETLCNVVDNNWKIVVDSDYLAQYSWLKNNKQFDCKNLYYRLKDNDNKIIYVANSYMLSKELQEFR